jgi:NDP-sugar pyrophosphorylase family protein
MNGLIEDFFLIEGFAHSALWLDKEPVWSALALLDEYFLGYAFESFDRERFLGVQIDYPQRVAIAKDVVLEPGVYIQGSCILGPGCIVRHGAYLRDGVICGKNCVIGHASEIKHSIFFDGAHAGHMAYVGDSIVGRRANLGAGVKCANLRLDRREIKVSIGGASISTGLKKMGAIIGDDCQIGCNAVINPGTLLGSGCSVFPLTHVSGAIAPRMRLKNRGGVLEMSPQAAAVFGWMK